MAKLDLQNRAPKVERLPDQRLRVTYVYDVLNFIAKTPAQLIAEVWKDWGTADDKYPDCRLIKQDITGQIDNPYPTPNKAPPQLVRVFEQIPETDEVAVGNPGVLIDQSNVTTVTQDYLQFSSAPPNYFTIGVSLAPYPHFDCVCKTDERTDDGTLKRIRRTFINSGILTTNDEEKNNGKLSIQTVTSVNVIPTTPSGYIVIDQKVDSPNGVPIYTYTFAKGSGQISYDTEYRLSTDEGVNGMTIITIRYLSDPSVDSNPITSPGVAFVLVSINKDDQDGYRIWTAIYGSGTGVVISSIELRNNGKLVIYSKTSINETPDAPSPTISGTVVLVSSSNRHDRFHEGVILYEATWAEGNGVIGNSIRMRTDGLREQTIVSLGTRVAPSSGIIIIDDNEEMEGVTRYNVTAMQSATGGDPADVTFSVERHVPFTYPGRAKAYTATASNGWTIVDVYRSPPIETLVLGTVSISYQTSDSLGTISNFWQPTVWATIEAEWIGLNNFPALHIEALRGYRSVDETPVSETVSIWEGDAGGTMLGQVIFGGTTAVATVTGGPEDPGGNTYTLEASLEPAFTGNDGTIYYRKTVISATIPAQEALPV